VALSSKSLNLLPNKLGYAVYDFWNKKYLGVMNGSLNVEVPSTGCLLLAVSAVTNHPQ